MPLCHTCQTVDVRAILLAANNAPIEYRKDAQGRVLSTLRDGIQKFTLLKSNLLALKASANSCDLCRFIWEQFCRSKQPHELSDDALNLDIGSQPIYCGTADWDSGVSRWPYVVAAQHYAPPREGIRQLAFFEVCAEEGNGPTDHTHLFGRVQASSASDQQCFDLANEWLRKCQDEHSLCQSVASTGRFPTRALDVGRSKELAFLVQGDGISKPYAALSYCWGGERDLLLESTTEEKLRSGLHLDDFPATLRDAIITTQKLKINYLWIDALCIFQDSKEDWAREAARMHDVYRGAAVTIEAASATRASEGFLRSRPSSKPYPQLKWESATCPSTTVYLRPIFDIGDQQLIGTKVYTRGWTLQERLLAPKTLSFGLQQASFECATSFVDEAGRGRLLPDLGESYLSKRSMLELRGEKGFISSARNLAARAFSLPPIIDTPIATFFVHGFLEVSGGWRASYHDYWRGIIQRFSERELTVSSDRLPALSGLAFEVQRATGDIYMAGLWKSELPRCLAWQRGEVYDANGPNGVGKSTSWIPPSNFVWDWPTDILPSSTFIAPSWSWASVRGRIHFLDGSYHVERKISTIAKVVGFKTIPAFEDPLGSLSASYLELLAPVLEVPDLRQPCDPSHPLAGFHNEVRHENGIFEETLSAKHATASEFYQHHVPHPGQIFAVIKLLTQDSKIQKDTLLWLLVIESCGDGTWRRLCAHRTHIGEIDKELERYMEHNENDPDYVKRLQNSFYSVKKVARQVETAPWKKRKIRLV